MIRKLRIREYRGIRYAEVDCFSFAYLDQIKGWTYVDLRWYNQTSIERWLNLYLIGE